MPRVFIPPQMRDLTGGVAEIDVEGESLRQLIDALDQEFSGIKARVVDGDHLIAGLAVSIDGDISTRGLRTQVGRSREVHFVPALGGGVS